MKNYYFNKFENPSKGISLLEVAKTGVKACGKSWKEVIYVAFKKEWVYPEFEISSYYFDQGYDDECFVGIEELNEVDFFNFKTKDFEIIGKEIVIHPCNAKKIFDEEKPYTGQDFENLNGRIFGSDWSVAFENGKWTLREEVIEDIETIKTSSDFDCLEIIQDKSLDNEYNEDIYPLKLEMEKNSWLYRNYIWLRAMLLSKIQKSPF